MIKKVFIHITGIVTVSILILVFGFSYFCYSHQQAAIEFWGDQYDPNHTPIKTYGFRAWMAAKVNPEGGPLINHHAASLCPDSMVSMIPIRQTTDGGYEVLCDAPSSDYIVVRYENIDVDMKKILDSHFNGDDSIEQSDNVIVIPSDELMISYD